MATTIEDLKNQIMERAKAQIATAEHDYQKGIEDCKMGVYDKWFRYHRKDDCIGWHPKVISLSFPASRKANKVIHCPPSRRISPTWACLLTLP